VSAPALALVILALALVAVVAGVVALIRGWSAEASIARRSSPVTGRSRTGTPLAGLDARLRRTRLGRNLSVRLVSAGAELRVVDFLLIAAGLGVAGYFASQLLLPTWLAVLAGVVGARLAWAWLERKREKRREEFVAQLPEVARLLSNSAAAGLSVRTAVEMAADELDEPAASEMGLVAEELRIGQSVEEALANLERRMPSREVGVLISALVIQQRSGGDLVRALQDMASTLESRRDLRREIRTMMAGSIYSGYLVGGLGAFMILLVNLISPGAIEEITGSPLGLFAFIVAGALYVTGYVMIRRVTRIEV
jgi:tight adherence protein B